LLADNERGKTIIIKIADRVVELPTSTENGHFESIIVISADDVAEHVDDGFIHFTAVTRGTESRVFGGTIRLLGPDGLSVISDIDDTVKVSYVTHRKSLLEHTFLLDFVAAPGMSERYRDWASNDMGFHFVSSSPWHLYEPLSEFLDQNDFPWATFSLKSIRFRDETLLDLFKKGTETKPAAIKKILDRYPERQFVLIGDSGEQDPEVYAALLRERPQQILKVYIRLITREHAGNERFKRVFDGIDPDCWQLFEDPSTLGLPSER
ncbi:MAG: DUF2183 domain-containing protein, partial [Gammaproteobacteria bacterium]|nr:DUF2183 domain-containing protein [Gammaproteobacteria bacterium]